MSDQARPLPSDIVDQIAKNMTIPPPTGDPRPFVRSDRPSAKEQP